MAERYLYSGTAFFAGFLSYLLVKIEKRVTIRNASLYIIVIIAALFSIRTIGRNFDWQNSKNLALATIKTSPQNIRAYNDLAGYYVLNKNFDKALYYYKEALRIYPLSNTAIRNLGNMYMNLGPLTLSQEGNTSKDIQRSETLFQEAKSHYENNETIPAVYFLVYALEANPDSTKARNLLGDMYLKGNKLNFAFEQFIKSIEIDKNQEEILFRLGYIEYKRKHLDKSKEYLKRTLELNPKNADALKNLSIIEEATKASPTTP